MKIIDMSGTPLTPSRHGRKCLGNGEHPDYECCCDECDYYFKCFPEYDPRPFRKRFKEWLKAAFKCKRIKAKTRDDFYMPEYPYSDEEIPPDSWFTF